MVVVGQREKLRLWVVADVGEVRACKVSEVFRTKKLRSFFVCFFAEVPFLIVNVDGGKIEIRRSLQKSHKYKPSNHINKTN